MIDYDVTLVNLLYASSWTRFVRNFCWKYYQVRRTTLKRENLYDKPLRSCRYLSKLSMIIQILFKIQVMQRRFEKRGRQHRASDVWQKSWFQFRVFIERCSIEYQKEAFLWSFLKVSTIQRKQFLRLSLGQLLCKRSSIYIFACGLLMTVTKYVILGEFRWNNKTR